MASVRTTRVAGIALVASAALLAALPAAAGEVVKIQRSIPIAANVDISTAVRNECELDTKISKFVKEFAGDRVEIVEGPLDHEKGRVLELEITEVWAPGGGATRGPSG